MSFWEVLPFGAVHVRVSPMAFRITVGTMRLHAHATQLPRDGDPASSVLCATHGEAERMAVEHLPQVNLIARHIYHRLPRHVGVEDLVNAGVLGLIVLSASSITINMFSSSPMPSSAFVGLFWTAFASLTGVPVPCGARRGES